MKLYTFFIRIFFLVYVSAQKTTTTDYSLTTATATATKNNNRHFAPSPADEYKRRPLFELTKHNYQFVTSSGQYCTLIFVEEDAHEASSEVRRIASDLALLLRNHFRDILIAHAFTSNLPQSLVTNIKTPSIMLLHTDEYQEDKQIQYKPSLEKASLKNILKWTFKGCGLSSRDYKYELKRANTLDKAVAAEDRAEGKREYNKIMQKEKLKDDKRDLSVIFKTGQTQALLNEHFHADSSVKEWVREYCSAHVDIEKRTARLLTKHRNITRINVKDANLHRVYCEHVFAGEPFVLTGASDNWESVAKWSNDHALWSELLHHDTSIQVDNGLEQSWDSSMTVAEYNTYMKNRQWVGGGEEEEEEAEEENKKSNSSLYSFNEESKRALERPPWSSVYAYLHQHSKLHNGKFAADVMWDKFDSPDIFKRNNWFQLMGSCYKMMTVTFWAAHGARQSNHQDDFGSSKWQVQVYGRKQWIMHPPEQSSYLYVVVSYCFFLFWH
jgi:hypothetical protein